MGVISAAEHHVQGCRGTMALEHSQPQLQSFPSKRRKPYLRISPPRVRSLRAALLVVAAVHPEPHAVGVTAGQVELGQYARLASPTHLLPWRHGSGTAL